VVSTPEGTMKTNLVYMTAGTKEEAVKIGKELVSERLAACVNVIDKMSSIYWWEGEVQQDEEVVLIAKTRESLVNELVEKVKTRHSYSVPCVVALPIVGGNQAFLDWIADETRRGG
jgi:periplasmic divalent cation tolerance protein